MKTKGVEMKKQNSNIGKQKSRKGKAPKVDENGDPTSYSHTFGVSLPYDMYLQGKARARLNGLRSFSSYMKGLLETDLKTAPRSMKNEEAIKEQARIALESELDILRKKIRSLK